MNFIYYDLPIEKWKEMINKEFDLRIKFNKLKKERKLNKKQQKEFRTKLKSLRYFLWINSPDIINKEKIREERCLACIRDFKRFNEGSNRIKQS